MHMVIKFLLSWFVRCILSWFYDYPRIELPWSKYVKTVAVSGVSSALDIGFSNWSFEFITVSLYTMTKSTSVVFIVMFSVLLKLEKKRPSLVIIVMLISCGLLMFSYESTQFDYIGFLLVLAASFLSGIRWSFTQLIVHGQCYGLSHPIDLMFHSQPWMALAILPLSLYIEGFELITAKNLFRTDAFNQLVGDLLQLCIGALLAFGLELSEYLVVSSASSLTLSVAGILKEVCTLYLASKFNGDNISHVNMIGFFICLCGIALHIVAKAVNSKKYAGEKHYS
ncbi:Solute carrier family 35 member C2 isoform 1 [Schistosoma japonicum]|uniref:Solute carrier family 35 member C2 isoform 1 n=1 Tax=Schistosoma japonicum TaxID=6182 RepID=A0A4Z2CMU1_SCHJA|nr:Solute carrier family 35 member C2 [Schistosoma japonicum]TNN05531.1 Solute carrier family 35 member C2 isoform 1 [Schistosoma japonicum]